MPSRKPKYSVSFMVTQAYMGLPQELCLGTFAHVEFSLDLLRDNLIPVQSWAGTGAFCVSAAPVLLKVRCVRSGPCILARSVPVSCKERA